jgi:TrmH family RNA methyltransferase
MSDLITSAANPVIARVRGLLARRDRRAEDHAFVAEGARAVADALEAGVLPHLLLLREGTPLPPGLPREVDLRFTSVKLFDSLSDVANPQGILAILPMPELPERSGAVPLILVADRMRDPGNLGTLLRAAAGAGATAIYLTAETVDPFNPKTVRAGMGAHWRIPIRHLPSSADALRALAPLVAVTAADAPTTYDALDYTGPAAIVIGSEAHGVSPELAAAATHSIAIPLAAGVESLNAATAGAVILFEAGRQRRHAG